MRNQYFQGQGQITKSFSHNQPSVLLPQSMTITNLMLSNGKCNHSIPYLSWKMSWAVSWSFFLMASVRGNRVFILERGISQLAVTSVGGFSIFRTCCWTGGRGSWGCRALCSRHCGENKDFKTQVNGKGHLKSSCQKHRRILYKYLYLITLRLLKHSLSQALHVMLYISNFRTKVVFPLPHYLKEL